MRKSLREILNKKLWKATIFITLGCFLLALGDAVFIAPFGLIPGGIISVGIIVQHFLDLAGIAFQAVDIVTWILQVILLVVSFLFLGKEFTLRTIYATVVYPLFFTLLYRVPVVGQQTLGNYLAELLVSTSQEHDISTATLLISAIFGGALIGSGVALTYLGDGSSGGFDVFCVIIARHTPIKEATTSFIIDGSLVLIGIFFTKNLSLGLLGILAAFCCAIAIQLIYSKTSSYVIAEIISEKSEEITDYVIHKMERTTTVIEGVGAYTGESRKVLRVAFASRELHDFREFIGKVDPRAFVTFTNASMINGEGFDPLVRSKKGNKNSK